MKLRSLLNSFYCAVTIILVLMNMPVYASPQVKSFTCAASNSWLVSPSMPSEVKKSGADGSSNFCDFYQFSWQAFLYLMSPAAGTTELRNYQVADKFPILEGSGNGSAPVNSCDATAPQNVLFVRTLKNVANDGDFILPEKIGQAGGGSVIYDQNTHVVFYEIRFSRNLCNAKNIQKSPNFPEGTTELKSAWKVLGKDEAAQYFTIKADIDGVPGKETLGLIGFHQAIATKDHPEFVWTTFEHKTNVPDCVNPQATPKNGWSFTSSQCADVLKMANNPLAIIQCGFNVAQPETALTGTPSEICREYAYGTGINDANATQNLDDIQDINNQLVGSAGYLSKLDNTNAMAVFKNYFMVGAIWLSDVKKPSSVDNQRGSLRLANSVAETTFQDVDLTSNAFVSNCFGCHNFAAPGNNTASSAALSHIFDDIAKGQSTDVEAGPIGNDADAKKICPLTCKATGNWNGQWKTTKPGQMSVCGCYP